MINHFSIAVKDHKKAEKFYGEALKPLGYTLLHSTEEMSMFSDAKYGDMFILHVGKSYPFHFAFNAENHESVDNFYKIALKNGGSDDGSPGYRESYGPNYYAAFIIDPDGYRIEAVCKPKAK